MATTTIESEQIENLEELVESLGGIPLWRIRFRPFPGTATEDDVLRALEAPRKRICELIDGILVEKSAEIANSILSLLIGEKLGSFVRAQNSGLVSGISGPMRLSDRCVCIPAVSFVSWDRCPGRRLPLDPIPTLVPNLVVEFSGPGNTDNEMARKREDYFSAGVEGVWIIDPEARALSVYTDPDTHTLHAATETISGNPVLPGFTLDLAMLFSALDRHG